MELDEPATAPSPMRCSPASAGSTVLPRACTPTSPNGAAPPSPPSSAPPTALARRCCARWSRKTTSAPTSRPGTRPASPSTGARVFPHHRRRRRPALPHRRPPAPRPHPRRSASWSRNCARCSRAPETLTQRQLLRLSAACRGGFTDADRGRAATVHAPATPPRNGGSSTDHPHRSRARGPRPRAPRPPPRPPPPHDPAPRRALDPPREDAARAGACGSPGSEATGELMEVHDGRGGAAGGAVTLVSLPKTNAINCGLDTSAKNILQCDAELLKGRSVDLVTVGVVAGVVAAGAAIAALFQNRRQEWQPDRRYRRRLRDS